MDTLRIAVCDDDARDTEKLKNAVYKICEETDVKCSVAVFESGASLLARAPASAFDIIFLDIYMDDNGIDTARVIRETDQAVKIIFVTSGADNALEAYSVFAYNYIVKPFEYAGLKNILDAAVRHVKKQNAGRLLFKSESAYHNIPFADIIFIESTKRQILIHTAHGNSYCSGEALNSVAKRLEDPRFLRPHNSFIVNMDHVSKIGDSCFYMDGGGQADITRRNFAHSKNRYFDYISGKLRGGNA